MALVSFDLDGVLQRNPFHGNKPHGVFGHISRELAPHVPGYADPAAAVSAALELVYAEHDRRMHAGRLVEAHDWDDIVATVAAGLNYPGRISVTQLVAEYSEKPGLVWHYPGAPEALQALVEAGHTLITLTNGFRCYQEPVVRKIGLFDYFTAFVTPEMAGAAKPEAGIFRAAEAYGGGRPGIHVGDTLPHDVAGAKRAGWQAIYIVQPGAPGYTEMPAELRALPPWERSAAGPDWLLARLEIDRRWHGYPPTEPEECIPDAIVTSLAEVPAAVAQLSSAAK